MASVRESVAECSLTLCRFVRSMPALPARSRHRPSVADIFQHSRTCIRGPAWVHCSGSTVHSAARDNCFVVFAHWTKSCFQRCRYGSAFCQPDPVSEAWASCYQPPALYCYVCDVYVVDVSCASKSCSNLPESISSRARI